MGRAAAPNGRKSHLALAPVADYARSGPAIAGKCSTAESVRPRAGPPSLPTEDERRGHQGAIAGGAFPSKRTKAPRLQGFPAVGAGRFELPTSSPPD